MVTGSPVERTAARLVTPAGGGYLSHSAPYPVYRSRDSLVMRWAAVVGASSSAG